MSPVTVVGISGLALGDLAFLHLQWNCRWIHSQQQFMSQRPKVILKWVQRHFRANLQGKCKFQRVCTRSEGVCRHSIPCPSGDRDHQLPVGA